LAHNATARTCAHMFGVGEASVIEVTEQVCEALVQLDMITWPTGESAARSEAAYVRQCVCARMASPF
jgi:hypothetical protein